VDGIERQHELPAFEDHCLAAENVLGAADHGEQFAAHAEVAFAHEDAIETLSYELHDAHLVGPEQCVLQTASELHGRGITLDDLERTVPQSAAHVGVSKDAPNRPRAIPTLQRDAH